MVFEELVEKPNGAKPVWADLAIKTPASPDYETVDNYELTSQESRRRIIDRLIATALEKEIKLLGTADYNLGLSERGIWIDDLTEAAGRKGISVY
ncbi:hypothetical protein GF359_04645, partial [candidate division WOR-3 bacterium]|nr:hypothetical protein [candidate division WOR-3 bacterium]MBD3364483.1 hypothetical protein [candidate division WOR-3 bacterium]